MRKLKVYSLVTIGAALLLSSCGGGNTKSGGGTKKFTSKTGWKPNDQRGWFFAGKQQKSKNWPGMVYVEGGTFTMGQSKDNVYKDWNNVPRRMQVSSFYMSETELTNYEYREYITWLKFVFPPSDPNFRNIYTGALPDTLLWNNELSRTDFMESYFHSPEYDYYPVVGVSWLQANRYCDWLTERANEKALIDMGIINKDLYLNEQSNQGGASFNLDKFKSNDPDIQSYINDKRWQQKFSIKSKNQRIVNANKNGVSNVVTKFRLPSEAEWEYAALGLAKNREYNTYLGKDPLEAKIRGTKGKNRGLLQGNFKYGTGDYSGPAGWNNDGAAITSDVRQYGSNDIGLYGMFGNVAEWTADVYRPIINAEYSDFNYQRGVTNTELVRNPDGTIQSVDANTIQYDTLSDGRLVYRALPGNFNRRINANYSKFRDGDYRSSLEGANGGKLDSAAAAQYFMYNSPRKNYVVNNSGKVVLLKDRGVRTSAQADYNYVVKGGSWKDNLYWLDPGQRRYKDGTKGYGWIGFRVAQDARDINNKRSKR